MLIDATVLTSDRLTAEICIVGTGMGGTSVAKRLVEAKADVLLVEAGGDRRDRSKAALVQYQPAGMSFGLPLTRVMEIGGGTNAWHGICAPLDLIDFEHRDWIPRSGWPISRNDLERYYSEARTWLEVGTTLRDTIEETAPEEMLSTWQILTPKRFWTSRTPARMQKTILRWTQEGRVRCLMHAVGLQLKADESGTVRSLLAGCGGRTIEIEAKVFVIAAGGLETPRLLLNSGRAFGAGAALTGRFLMDHPVGYFSQAVFRKKLNVAFGGSTLTGRTGYLTGLSIRAELQKEYRLPNHYVFVRPGTGPAKIPNDLLRSFLGVRGVLDLTARHMMTILKSRYILQRVVCERFGVSVKTRFGDIYVMAEQLPNPDSRVDLSTDQVDGYGYPIARVNWRLSHDEWQSFGSFISLVAAGLRGDERIASLRLDDIAEWPQVLSSAAHHLGTARMAATPRQGVVDADLRVFGCRNLFVCDGSVFPTASGTNPSFTICALGLRLGEHLVRLFISAGGRGSDHAVWGAALATITRRPVA